MMVYISAHALHKDKDAVKDLMSCIDNNRHSIVEPMTVMLSLPGNKNGIIKNGTIIKRMTDIILHIKAPVTITTVGGGSSLKMVCGLIRIAKMFCKTDDQKFEHYCSKF